MSPQRFDTVLAAMRRRAVVARAEQLAQRAAREHHAAALTELRALAQHPNPRCRGGLACRCGYGTAST